MSLSGLFSRTGSMLILGCMLAFAAAPAGAQDSAPDPQQAKQKVQDVTDELLGLLRELHAEDDVDMDRMRERVTEIVEPHLDFVTMTRLAVGRHWRDASNDQKRALVIEFRELLVRTYSAAIDGLEDIDMVEFVFLPLRESPHEDRVEVRSRIVQSGGGDDIPVDYGLRYRDGDWLLYDITIEGVSLVTTYRSGFSAVVARQGIDGLIDDLRRKNERGETEVPDLDQG